MIEAQGRLGASATFDGNVVVLRRGGYSSAVTGSGEHTIPISQIASVEFRKARRFLDGYIRFVIAGAAKPPATLGRRTRDARFDEFAVPFWRKTQPQFEVLRDAVRNALQQLNGARPPAAANTAAANSAAALRELEQLRAQGLITPAEYEAKRTEIIDRM